MTDGNFRLGVFTRLFRSFKTEARITTAGLNAANADASIDSNHLSNANGDALTDSNHLLAVNADVPIGIRQNFLMNQGILGKKLFFNPRVVEK